MRRRRTPRGQLPATPACSAAGVGSVRPVTLGRRFVTTSIPTFGSPLLGSGLCAPEFCGLVRMAGNVAPPLASGGRGVRSAGPSFGWGYLSLGMERWIMRKREIWVFRWANPRNGSYRLRFQFVRLRCGTPSDRPRLYASASFS